MRPIVFAVALTGFVIHACLGCGWHRHVGCAHHQGATRTAQHTCGHRHGATCGKLRQGYKAATSVDVAIISGEVPHRCTHAECGFTAVVKCENELIDDASSNLLTPKICCHALANRRVLADRNAGRVWQMVNDSGSLWHPSLRSHLAKSVLVI